MSEVKLNEVQVENGEGGEVTLVITVPAAQVQKSRQQVLRQYARKVKIPGFRPGHAPMGILRRTVGDDNISQALSDEIVPAAYQQAIDDQKMLPLTRGEVADLTLDAFDADADMSFKATVILRPEITLGDTAELTATRPDFQVKDEEIEDQLERIREENATFEDITERGAQEEDIIMATAHVFVDGEPRTEEPERLQPFRLGQSNMVPPLDDQLIGIKIDEERTIDATYPEDFKDAELAGKAAKFTVKVTALKERKPAELTDDLAQALGVADLADLRTRIREAVEQEHQRRAKDEVRNQITESAAEKAELEVPSKMTERRVADRVAAKEAEYKRNDKTLDDFLTEEAKTREDWEAELTNEEAKRLREDLVLDEVAKLQELKVPTEELEDYFVNLAQMLKQPIEDVVKRFDVQAVHASLLRQKAVDWLVDQAKVDGAEAASEKITEETEAEPATA